MCSHARRSTLRTRLLKQLVKVLPLTFVPFPPPQVQHMAAHLSTAQQQQQQQRKRLQQQADPHSLRVVDAAAKRAECGGSFQAYLAGRGKGPPGAGTGVAVGAGKAAVVQPGLAARPA